MMVITDANSDFEIGFLSDPGRKRRNEPNQDSFEVLQADPERNLPLLLILADGMGGYSGGAVASQKVVEAIKERFQQAEDTNNLPSLLDACLQAAFKGLQTHAAKNPDLLSMGSTAVLAAFQNEQVFVANVGDSRAYLIHVHSIRQDQPTSPWLHRTRQSSILGIWSGFLRRKRKRQEKSETPELISEMQQLSYDHSVVADQVRAGQITPLQARRHPKRNRLTQSISPKRKEIKPYIAQSPFEGNDILVLCTDGLWNVVPETILQAIAVELPPQEAAVKLVDLANQNGGPDNISVIIARRASVTPISLLHKN